jgi:leucyl aminopeptidase (aminopeptidase T)
MMQTIGALEGAFRILEPNVKAGESLAIIGSTDVDQLYYEILMAAADKLGIVATLGLMTPRSTYGKPAPPALEAMAIAADLALLTASTSLAHSTTALAVLKAGKRAFTFPVPPGPGRAVDVLRDQRVFDIDKLLEIKRLSKAVGTVLDDGKNVRITSPLGTDISVRIDGRKTHSWYGLVDPDDHMYTAWPPGDAHVSTLEETAEGIAVVDGYIGGMGVPSEPLTMIFKKGKLVDLKGRDAFKLEAILAASDENARVFCEVGIGTNPWQRPVVSNGDKYTVGTFHLAIGGDATPCFGGVNFDGKNFSNLHLDCLMLAPVKVEVDGRELVGGGKIHT